MAHPGSARTHVSSRGASILLGARELSLSSPEPAAARGSLGPLARPPKAALRARRRRLTRVPAGVLSPRLDLRRTRAPFCLATPHGVAVLLPRERGPPAPAHSHSLDHSLSTRRCGAQAAAGVASILVRRRFCIAHHTMHRLSFVLYFARASPRLCRACLL